MAWCDKHDCSDDMCAEWHDGTRQQKPWPPSGSGSISASDINTYAGKFYLEQGGKVLIGTSAPDPKCVFLVFGTAGEIARRDHLGKWTFTEGMTLEKFAEIMYQKLCR